MDGIAAVLCRNTGDDGADENGEEGPALDQRIAGRQFGAGKMVRQDAVFDRSEQRSDRTVQSDRDEQQNDRVDGEAQTANAATAISNSFSRCATSALS